MGMASIVTCMNLLNKFTIGGKYAKKIIVIVHSVDGGNLAPLGCTNPVNHGINYQPQLVNAGFQPSTVVHVLVHITEFLANKLTCQTNSTPGGLTRLCQYTSECCCLRTLLRVLSYRNKRSGSRPVEEIQFIQGGPPEPSFVLELFKCPHEWPKRKRATKVYITLYK